MISPNECINYLDKNLSWITSGDDTQYSITVLNNNELIISFLESNSKIDWKNNFNFFKKPYKNMNTTYFVHGGFLKCWKLIRDEINEKIKILNPSSITVTGHSYGGAMAILCIEDIWFCFPELRNNIQCITFGAPRVIGIYNWKKIKERWNNTRQFKNGADIVTCIPFASMFFKHVRPLIHIGDKIKFWKYFKVLSYHPQPKYKETLNNIFK